MVHKRLEKGTCALDALAASLGPAPMLMALLVGDRGGHGRGAGLFAGDGLRLGRLWVRRLPNFRRTGWGGLDGIPGQGEWSSAIAQGAGRTPPAETAPRSRRG